MSAFSNIPAHAVLPLGAYRLEELTRAARRADQRLLIADLAGSESREDVLRRLASGFGLSIPAEAGCDALLRGLTGLQPPSDADPAGFVIILQNLPDTAQFGARHRAELLDVFRDAADHFFDCDTAFRVFYSVGSSI